MAKMYFFYIITFCVSLHQPDIKKTVIPYKNDHSFDIYHFKNDQNIFNLKHGILLFNI